MAAPRSPDYASRRAAVRDLLMHHELDALLVTDLLNIRYLTGFTGSNAALLVHAWDSSEEERRTVVCTDGRYQTQIAVQVPDLRAEISKVCVRKLIELTGEWSLGRLGFESHVMTVDEHRSHAELGTGVELVRSPGMVERLRMVKDEHEVALLRSACAAADAALAQLIDKGGLRPGRTERAVARELEWLMFEHGADAVAFETIVATGANSAVPHHRPTDAVLASGDFVKLDFGAVVGGYHSDMTRTVMLGSVANWQRDLYELVARAQAAGRSALRPGAAVGDVDAAARSVIEAAGYGELFLHGLGHGVGLQIHEAPSIGKAVPPKPGQTAPVSKRPDRTGTLLDGVAVTVEPGVYFSGRGGVRIEDTLVVREQGPELLTLTGKDLIVV